MSGSFGDALKGLDAMRREAVGSPVGSNAPDAPDESVQAFLNDLTELSLKHRLAIGGCGCCGSPHISKIEEEELLGGRYELNTDGENLGWHFEEPEGSA